MSALRLIQPPPFTQNYVRPAAVLDQKARFQKFEFRLLDHSPRLLAESYRLRYEVYCLERGFLDPRDYPDQIEQDEYDVDSLHFGAINAAGEIVGTVRMVMSDESRFPMLDHCEIERSLDFSRGRTAEISRLAISRHYRRRAGDDSAGISPDMLDDELDLLHRRRRPEIVMGLYKAVYQESRRLGINCWLAAMERSLVRLLARHAYFFDAIGPQVDYYGPVTPYVARIRDLERAVQRRDPAILAAFQAGL